MPSPNLSEIVTTTLQNYSGVLADNISKNNAILERLNRKGKEPAEGGRTILQELMYAENSTMMWYSGYDFVNIQPSDSFSAAEFDWKQAVAAVTISGLEELQNASKERIHNLVRARVKVAEITMDNAISAGCYGDGTGTGGKEIGGLQFLVADAPSTGTVGGVNRANFPFYRNFSRDSSDAGVTASATTVQSEFGIMYTSTCRGKDKVDLIMCDNTWWLYYLGSLQAIQRITEIGEASAGFQRLKYMGADVVFDGGGSGMDGGCPANHAYFLNTNYIHWRPHSARNMVPIGGDRMNTNQDAIVKLIGFAGNMTLSNARLQGVLKV